MKFYSNDFNDNELINSKFTCDGKDQRPHLVWSDIPAETKSLALAIFDPDAPGSGWLHWLVVNMPPINFELTADKIIPEPGIQLPNDFGREEYGGPCPPTGVHKYEFILYALDISHIEPQDYEEFLDIVNKHTLEQVKLIGLYQRK